ncbi:hypothetical protein ACFQ1S_37280, partial [Kibdelosporangium lantanae]
LTPQQLDVLAEAGVVDAGGRGVLVLLESLVTVVNERDEPVVPYTRAVTSPVAAREAGSTEFGYEVMYLLDTTDEKKTTALRDTLGNLGDCVSVVGDGDGLWTVHVHCNDVGAAIRYPRKRRRLGISVASTEERRCSAMKLSSQGFQGFDQAIPAKCATSRPPGEGTPCLRLA